MRSKNELKKMTKNELIREVMRLEGTLVNAIEKQPGQTYLTVEQGQQLLSKGWMHGINFWNEYVVPIYIEMDKVNSIAAHTRAVITSKGAKGRLTNEQLEYIKSELGDALLSLDSANNRYTALTGDEFVNIQPPTDFMEALRKAEIGDFKPLKTMFANSTWMLSEWANVASRKTRVTSDSLQMAYGVIQYLREYPNDKVKEAIAAIAKLHGTSEKSVENAYYTYRDKLKNSDLISQ